MPSVASSCVSISTVSRRCLAAVARRTQRFQVGLIAEQRLVSIVRLDVVDVCCQLAALGVQFEGRHRALSEALLA